MPTCTEICLLPLIPGSQIGDPNDAAAAAFKDSMDMLAQRDGLQDITFGTWVENLATLQLIINWDSRQKHRDFETAEEYPAFIKRITSIMDSPHSVHHATFEPSGALRACMSAPVTEIATFYFTGAPPADYLANAAKFSESAHKANFEGFVEMTAGVTEEELEREGVKGRAAVVLIGWHSVESHMAFRQTQAFKDNIHLLRNGAEKIEMHHVVCMGIAN